MILPGASFDKALTKLHLDDPFDFLLELTMTSPRDTKLAERSCARADTVRSTCETFLGF